MMRAREPDCQRSARGSVFVDRWWSLYEQRPPVNLERAAIADRGRVTPRVQRRLPRIEVSDALRQAPILLVDASGVQTGPDQHADTEQRHHPGQEEDGAHRPHRPVPA